jgi:non-heme chloroperoxidase
MTMRAVLVTAFTVVVLGAAVLGGMIAFGTAPTPPPVASLNAPMLRLDYRDLPALERYRARDGAALSYRAYPGGEARVVILVHGSALESSAMHAVATRLSVAGMTVYSLTLRGHGGDGRAGDIDYIGQLDDDLADFVRIIRVRHPLGALALVGHSAGGGFALRIAEGQYGDLFDRYVLLSPALYRDAPTYKPRTGGWATPYVPRIIALIVLNHFGVHWFDGLPVIVFAVPKDVPVRLTPTYSFRLQRNLAAPDTYLKDLANVRKPITLLVGEQDELFYADRFAPLLTPIRPDVVIEVIPGITHTGMLTEPAALGAIVAALTRDQPAAK